MALIVAIAWAAAAACGEPWVSPDEAEWAIPVPPETRVVELDYVPVPERTARVALVEDLVIEERGDDVNYVFGRDSPNLAVDREGNIYAVDNSRHHIRVFDADGDYLRRTPHPGPSPVAMKLGPARELYVAWACGEELEARCIDVYSARGERRLAAQSADLNLDSGWQAADEGFVYGVPARDGYGGEYSIVRYRIVTQFE